MFLTLEGGRIINFTFSLDAKEEIIVIDNIKYIVDPILPFSACETLLDELNSPYPNYRVAVCKYIQQQILGDNEHLPSIELIANQNNIFFENFFSLVFLREPDLKDCFEDCIEISDPCERFVFSISAFFVSIGKHCFDKYINSFADGLNYVVSNELQDFFVSIGEKISSALKDIHLPEISEKRKQEIVNNHYKWGALGWTQPSSAPDQILYDAPGNAKIANEMILSYCTDDDMQRLFSLLRNLNGILISDLDEAIFDFEHKKYKSCVLILFSLIDGKLISLQHKDGKKNRPSGKIAAENLFKYIRKEKDIERKYFQLLTFKNIFSCLSKVFEGGNDFVVQPKIVNRNFVVHGMYEQKVSKMDCIQVFLLYYNFLNFLNTVF